MDPAGRVSSASSRIFTTTAIESRDEWDERIDRAHGVLLGLTADLSEKEAHDALTSAVCKDAKTHEEVCIGLTCTILIDPQNAARSYRDLTFVSRDGLTLVLNYLVSLVAERSARLLDSVRAQLLWRLKELMRTNVNGTDNLVWNLMRQIAGGDVSPKNLWLAESLMDLLIDHRPRLGATPTQRGEDSRVRLALERHFTQSEGPVTILHRSDTVDADTDVAALPLLTADTRHGKENGVPHVLSSLWSPETIPGLVPAPVPFDGGVTVVTL